MLWANDSRGWAKRVAFMLFLLLVAGPCYAEDPLETLNTVEDTLSTMERTLQAQQFPGAEKGAGREGSASVGQGEEHGKELYFVSEEPLGATGWVAVRPCLVRGGLPLLPGPEVCADE